MDPMFLDPSCWAFRLQAALNTGQIQQADLNLSIFPLSANRDDSVVMFMILFVNTDEVADFE